MLTTPGAEAALVDLPGQVSHGDSPTHPTVDLSSTGPASSLTPRQLEAVYLVASGLTYAEAAAVMCITVQSLKNHMSSAYARLDVGGIVPAMNALGLVRL